MPDVELDEQIWRGLEYLEVVSGPGAIAEMVGAFEADAPARIARMAAALEAEAWSSLSGLAHDLKSNSASVGLGQLSSRAAEIERIARDGASPLLAPLLAAARELLPPSLRAIQDRARNYPA
ncbi:MAG TPA: Hpt domain-containing protein [Holophaga sp.]|nr:Hpt domain-containing protein [Holophaga sp.]